MADEQELVEDQLTEEQKTKFKKLEGIRNQNHRMNQEIHQAGVAADTSSARVEHVMSFLRDKGVITLDDQIDEQMSWELNLRSQLQPVLQRIKQATGVPHRRESGIVVPGMNGIPRSPRG